MRPASVITAALMTGPAIAQRAQDNAVTAAGDAFGVTVGAQTIGLYSTTDVRGFNPGQAQNLRIDGLYYDQQGPFTTPFLFSRSDIRVGVAAQSYSFPSPTGIVDYKLRTPGDDPLTSLVFMRGPLDAVSFEVDAQEPLVPKVLSAGAVLVHQTDWDYNYGRTSTQDSYNLLLRIRPDDGTEIVPFVGYTHQGEHQEFPLVYADGLHGVPQFDQQHLQTQQWTSFGASQFSGGVAAHGALGIHWLWVAGVFRSVAQTPPNSGPLLLNPDAAGLADHLVDTAPAQRAGSYSGDFRITRTASGGTHEHALTLDLRGRDVKREFGGDAITDLGRVSIYQIGSFPAPSLVFTPLSLDRVRQVGIGASYNERWTGLGSLNVGLLQTWYRRSVVTPGVSAEAQDTAKLLPNVSINVDLAKNTNVYASYVRGLEDSPTAPNSAVNRGESVPATPTWQIDGGVRVSPMSKLQFLLGAFEVRKTYYNVAADAVYRQIGTISSRGIEGSVSYASEGGLTVVAGLVALHPEVTSHQSSETVSRVPVGPVPRTINVNVDYAPRVWGRWAAGLQWTYLSRRTLTNDSEVQLPVLSTLGLNVRYRLTLFNRACSARLDVANVTDERGLTVSSVYQVLPELRRNYLLTLAADI